MHVNWFTEFEESHSSGPEAKACQPPGRANAAIPPALPGAAIALPGVSRQVSGLNRRQASTLDYSPEHHGVIAEQHNDHVDRDRDQDFNGQYRFFIKRVHRQPRGVRGLK
jgi:hypothetical protein